MTDNTKEAALRDPVASAEWALAEAMAKGNFPFVGADRYDARLVLAGRAMLAASPQLRQALTLGLAILDENDGTLERALDEALPFAEYDVGNLRASLLRTIE